MHSAFSRSPSSRRFAHLLCLRACIETDKTWRKRTAIPYIVDAPKAPNSEAIHHVRQLMSGFHLPLRSLPMRAWGGGDTERWETSLCGLLHLQKFILFSQSALWSSSYPHYVKKETSRTKNLGACWRIDICGIQNQVDQFKNVLSFLLS